MTRKEEPFPWIGLSIITLFVIGTSLLLQSIWPFVIFVFAMIVERVWIAVTNKTTKSTRSTRPTRLPRALCTSCGRTVATTEHKGVQRYRAHRINASKDAPICERSRKIVGDETSIVQLDIEQEGRDAIAEVTGVRIPPPTFRPSDGSTPETEPTADEQFGTRSKFNVPESCHAIVDGAMCGYTLRMHEDNELGHAFVSEDEATQFAAGGE